MIELRIDSLAFGGDGVGRHQGQAVFVPLTAPGDLIRCRITQRKRRFLRGEAVEILQSGPGRCQPRCPVFTRCGGCQWQHLDYPAQLTVKEEIFGDILRRQLQRNDISLLPILGAEVPWNYRSRVQFKCYLTGSRPAIGFFRRGSHFVETIESCPIAADGINSVLPWIYRHIPKLPRPDRISQIDVSVGDRGRPRLVIHDLASQKGLDRNLQNVAEQEGFSLFVRPGKEDAVRHVGGRGDIDLRVDDPPLWLSYGPGGFSQVNLAQNRILVDRVLDLARLQGDEHVLDLYCGMGNLTLPLSRRCDSIVGVEDYSPAIDQARTNASLNEIANARFVAADAAVFLAGQNDHFDLVVLDPPRSGAAPLVEPLLKLKPTRILYVSCDPMTLARDLKPLLDHGYRLTTSQVLDLFPQTYHLESISLLEVGAN